MPKTMVFKPLSLLFFVMFLFQSLAQTTSSEQLKTSYEEHFKHQREALHLHLNKNVFYVGEEVWWTAYAYNKKTSEPSLETTNLYCGIYDANDKQIKEGMFLVEDGVTHGSFELDGSLEDGTYIVRATTSWMQNFEGNRYFETEITVINKGIEDTVQEVTKAYDVKILPEGGHIVKNTQCNIGVKLTDKQGKGIASISGKVVSSSNRKVTDVSLNDYGVGKFSLPANVDFPLFLEIATKDGTVIKKDVPAPKEMGIALNVNNIVEDKLFVSLKTNQATLKKIQGKAFYLAVHRDGLMALKTFKITSLEKEIKIDKSKLLNGTNIVTLFDQDLNPLAERLVFNFKDIKVGKLTVEKPKRKNKDSIAFKINAFSKSKSVVTLSVSALPSQTKAKHIGNNIISNLLLKPYLKSAVENPARYFDGTDRTTAYELDLVLLTQGWSSYNWETVFKGAPEIQYPFEHGVTVSGTINSKIRKGDELAVNYGDVAKMLFVELKDSTKFQINNLFNYNKDTLLLAVRNKNKKLRKPEVETTFSNNFDLGQIDFEIPSLIKTPYHLEANETKFENTAPPLFIKGKTIALEAVEVTEERIEKQLKRASPLINSAFKGIKIGEKEIKRNLFLLDFIAKNGFLVDFVVPTGQVVIRNNRPGFQGGGSIPTPSTDDAPDDGIITTSSSAAAGIRVYEDDFLVNDLTQLLNVPMSKWRRW